METKRSLSIVAALLAFGIGAPAAALAADPTGSTPSAPLTTGAVNQSTADEQNSGEQGDVANADLATQVEEVDGANNNSGVNEEGQVGDGSDGQLDNGPLATRASS